MLSKFFSKFFSKQENKTTPGLLAISFDKKGIAFAYQREPLPKPTFTLTTYIELDDGADRLSIVKQFVDSNDLGGVACSLILSPHEYRLIFLDAPAVDELELGGAAKWLVKDFIDIPLNEALVDAFKVPVRVGQPEKMYAVVANLAHVKEVIQLLQQAGLNTVCVDIAELALRNIMSYLEEGDKEVGLLMMQPEFHALLVTRQRTLCLSRNIETPIIYTPMAEQSAEEQESVAHLTGEIERSVAYFQSHIGKGDFNKIWIATLLSDEHQLMKALSELLTVPLDILDLNLYFNFKEKLDSHQQVKLMLAIGGALRLGWTDASTG